MKQALARIYLAFCSLVFSISLMGQDMDDVELDGGLNRRKGDDMESLSEVMEYQGMHFSLSDVVMVVFLLVACYVFGKIWKGCSYLLLALAAVFYYLLRY